MNQSTKNHSGIDPLLNAVLAAALASPFVGKKPAAEQKPAAGDAPKGRKVTREQIESKIESITYARVENTTTTLCIIHLVNGYDVIGQSACVDPANFDELLGQKLAYKEAFEKIWPLEGYLLAEEMYQSAQADKDAAIASKATGAAKNFLLFGEALGLLFKGAKVARVGWNGKGMWLSLTEGRYVMAEQFWSDANREFAEKTAGKGAFVRPYITMKAADGTIVPWTASQSDILASDWVVVE